MLLGSNIFWILVCVGKIQLSNKNLSLQKTYLGWVLTGSLNLHTLQEKTTSCLSVNTTNSNATLSKFWEIEEIQNCSTHAYDNDGEFIVGILFKKNIKIM